MRLLRDVQTIDGRRVRTYTWRGHAVRVRDDVDTALRVVELFADTKKAPQTKLAEVIDLLFLDAEALVGVEDVAGLLALVCWEEVRLDIDGTHRLEAGQKVIDWEQDADYIQASLLAGYGVEWERVRYAYSYADLCALLGLVPRDTPFGQALYYRTATPPRRTANNAEQCQAWAERREFWAIKKPDADKFLDLSDATEAAFAAFRR